ILATTSRPVYMGSFPHMPWMVTSLGVVVSLVSVLEDSQVLQQHGINMDKDKRTVVVQGFGDVSSGIVKLLLTTYKELGFRITGVSDIDGAIYSEKGLDPDELMRLRTRFESGEKFKLTEAYQARGGEIVERYAGDPDAILYKECTVLMLGAGSNMFTNKKNNTHRIKAKLIVEGANNAFESGLENKLHEMGILYIPGPVANGAGIYTSTEEVIHYHMSKLNGLKDHVLNAITDYSAPITATILKMYKDSGYKVHPYKMMQDLSKNIRETKKGLLKEGMKNILVARRADTYIKRGLPQKYALIIAASEIAHSMVYYKEADARKKMLEIAGLAGNELARALFILGRVVVFREEPTSALRNELKIKLIGLLREHNPVIVRRAAAEALSYVCEGMEPAQTTDAVAALERAVRENGEVGTWASWSVERVKKVHGDQETQPAAELDMIAEAKLIDAYTLIQEELIDRAVTPKEQFDIVFNAVVKVCPRLMPDLNRLRYLIYAKEADVIIRAINGNGYSPAEKLILRSAFLTPGEGMGPFMPFAAQPGQESIAMISNIAESAGRQISDEHASPYTLAVPLEMFKDKDEFEKRQSEFGSRFNLICTSALTADPETFVQNLMSNIPEERRRGVIALVPSSLKAEHLEELKKAGMRFIPVSDQLAKVKDYTEDDREMFQVNTFAGMLVLRHINDYQNIDSVVYRISKFYALRHITLKDGITLQEFIKAVVDGNIGILVKVCFEPTQPKDAKKEHDDISRPLIFA
ncbi:MAG: hypothetical protein PHI58_04580, partial [Candidatus Omnitrophica bacterium]|nr:hypothetical protein [Candidatus Omnitrophota bacterium]